MKKFGLVVAAYREDISWVEKIPLNYFDIFIYRKDKRLLKKNEILLDNIGRESDTYFNHIIKNYHNLNEIIFFTQGNPLDHVPNFIEILSLCDEEKILLKSRERIISDTNHLLKNNNFFGFGAECWVQHGLGSWAKRDYYQAVIPIWNQIFKTKIPERIYFTQGAIFGVKKDSILNRSLQFYEKNLQINNGVEYMNRSGAYQFELLHSYLYDKNYESIY